MKRLEKLEKSLSETLAQFYPFAGRFVRDDFSVECNDEGVDYLEARVSGFSLGDIIRGKFELKQLDIALLLIWEQLVCTQLLWL